MKKIMTCLAVLSVAALFIGTFVFLYGKSHGPVETFGTVSPSYGDISNRILITGHIEPRKEINIKSRVAGIIQNLEKEAGMSVKKGEIIATIQIVPEMIQLSAARSRVEVARINLANCRDTLRRNRELFQSASISESKMDEHELAADLAQAELKAARENLQLILEGRAGDRDTASNTLIRSTIDGMILSVPVKQGDSVIESNSMNEGTTIAVIADMKDMIFKGTVDEIDVEKVKTGMPVAVTLSADRQKVLSGVTEFISPKGTQTNGAVKFDLRATLDLPDEGLLRSGYSAAGEIVLAERKHVLMIDEGVVTFEEKGAFVNLVTGEDPLVCEHRTVTTGLSDGIHVEIVAGLESGDKVKADDSLVKSLAGRPGDEESDVM
ncbi:rnd efflux pump membrane fusion protein [Desulfoluna butyratoxydans]|uniref:Rnd efflux pump membrane fusion protein n=2 Tax=Desulfoluna butyratoxydans TaxID=231438 RepID=A0A4U8YH13_9BACT|nr:rnd efflux pump membrane fusion protein [Desulfoluna butyratoxydans]